MTMARGDTVASGLAGCRVNVQWPDRFCSAREASTDTVVLPDEDMGFWRIVELASWPDGLFRGMNAIF